jgi:hypothetical protein
MRRKKGRGRRVSPMVFAIPLSLTFIALIAIGGILRKQGRNKRMRDELHEKIITNVQSGNGIDHIINGDVHLINISKVASPATDANSGSNKTYSLVGIFCHLDWDLHKNSPSTVPMNKDLINQSKLCKSSTIRVDLHEAVTKAREFDRLKQKNTNTSSSLSPMVRTMEPKGFVFHESRCGSTLVANSLAAFDPEKTRVYSESSPPINAAKLYNPAEEEESLQLVRDVIYLMGRTNDEKEEHLFFKIQSIGVKSIHIFRKAFPQTPWLFVYRDPVQVMRSHLKSQGTSQAVCLRSKRSPQQDLIKLVHRIGGIDKNLSTLSTEEFCAAHLATLCEAAITQIKDSDGLGKAVNYSNLMTSLVEELIPKHFLNISSLSDGAKTNIAKVSEYYSKGRRGGKEWKEDSQQKEITAWEELKNASAKYLQPSYLELETSQH